jgi:aryl-alcohol dehydrogenase-like predicted oxidoreductase
VLSDTCAKAVRFAKEKGVDLPQLAVQFSLSNPDIHTTLVGTAVPAELHKNFKWWKDLKEKGMIHLAMLRAVMMTYDCGCRNK